MIVAAAGLSGFGPPASADGETIRASVTEKIQYDDNIRLEPNPSGWVFGSTTSLDVGAKTSAPLADFGLNLGADFNRFTGPGATSGLNSLDWDAGLEANRRTSRARLGGRADYRRQTVRESEVDDGGGTGGDAKRETRSASARFSYDQTSRDVLGIAGSIRDVSFSGDAGGGRRTPYVAGDMTLSWRREVTPRDIGTASFRTQVFDADNEQDTFSRAFSLGVSYERRQTPRLTLYGTIGGGVIVEDRDVALGQGTTTRRTETSPTVNIISGAAYTVERSSARFELSQDIQASATGAPTQRRSARLNLAHEMTPAVTFDLSASYTNQRAAVDDFRANETDRDFHSVEGALNWRFHPAWVFTAGYRYRRDDDSDGLATSNAVFALLRYDFTIRP